MDEDASHDVTAGGDASASDGETLQWRRDASTSRTVRLLWSLGAGTFFAAIVVIVSWRLYDVARQFGGQSVVLAALAAVVVTILVLSVTGNAEAILERLTRRLPVDAPTGTSLERAIDAAVGAVAMGTVITGLMVAGRIAARPELLGEGGESPFTGLAALTIPLALVALVLASFLQSVGALDRDEGTLYLYEPKQAIDLSLITDVSIRHVGDAAVLKLRYAQPDGQYVQGPRRIVVPPAVAREVKAIVESRA